MPMPPETLNVPEVSLRDFEAEADGFPKCRNGRICAKWLQLARGPGRKYYLPGPGRQQG